jgi:virginiamycin B lyase
MAIMQPAMTKGIRPISPASTAEQADGTSRSHEDRRHFFADFGWAVPLTACAFSVFLAGFAPGAAQAPARPGVKTPGIKIPVARLKPDAVYQVPGSPDWLAIDEDNRAVWVSNAPRNSVSRLDPATDHVVAIVTAGKKPCSGLAAAFGTLWVPNCGDGTLSRIDLKTNTGVAGLRTSVGDSEGSIVSGAESIWVMTDGKGTLARIDPASNAIVAEVYVPSGSFGIAFGEGAVWVTSTEHDSLTRVDPATNLVVETIPVGKAPRFAAAGLGAVWTLNQGDGSVSRIDPKTNKVVATIEVGVPGPGGEIAAGEGSVWVTTFDFPLSRIDPASNAVVQQFFGEGGDAVRAGLGFVWLSNLKAGNVWRLDPRRIEATVPN